MSYDTYYSRRPWEDYRGARSTKSSISSSLYSVHRSVPAAKHALRLQSSPVPGLAERMDLAQVSTLNSELLGLRAQEKEQLVGLNDRFATYIEKVRHLEQQNKALLAELEALRQRQRDPSRLHLLYEQEARGLRALLDAETNEKMRLEAEREHLRDVHGQLKERCEDEARLRADGEDALRKAREEAARAALANCDAEASAGSLAEELAFLRKVFAEEHAELTAQVQAAGVSVEVDVEAPDLSSSLRDVRSQYEKLANKNMQAAEDWYRTKFAGVAQATSRNGEAVRAMREETSEYRRLLQARSSEIEALRNVIDSLNKQLEDMEDRQGKEVTKYQEKINDLEKDIAEAKQEMTHYLREYQDLLNVKMALDIEIAAYRKLLEGEEIRLSFSSLPALT
ncbi:hypothetical protein COCON_G00106800 [Conger conger]|uniref:IF rod domain-containing protein n=1 Tax=Conger conger TaxID=82655 RepID=A0A9Q1DIZ1_CONCO|nr:hypothetical protein COCON_G00106800 [Conger conger]